MRGSGRGRNRARGERVRRATFDRPRVSSIGSSPRQPSTCLERAGDFRVAGPMETIVVRTGSKDAAVPEPFRRVFSHRVPNPLATGRQTGPSWVPTPVGRALQVAIAPDRTDASAVFSRTAGGSGRPCRPGGPLRLDGVEQLAVEQHLLGPLGFAGRRRTGRGPGP